MQAITSPFSESWGEYRLRKEDFSWHKANEGRLKGKWLRGLWSNELYQERRSSTTGRADDMMAVATLSLPPTLKIQKFVELFKLAYMHMRFVHPMLGVTIETNVLSIPLLPCFVYEQVTSFDEVQAWADRTVHVHTCESEQDRALSETDRIQCVRNTVGTRPLPISQHTREWHIICFGREEDAHHVALMSYCAHSVSDARAELLLLQQLLDEMARLEGAWPVSASHPSHPAAHEWGSEIKRLTPSLMEMIGVPIDAFEEEAARELVSSVSSEPSLRLDEGRPIAEPELSETLHARVVFSKEETDALHQAAKAHGWSLTHLVDAARHMAYMQVRRPYLEAWHWSPIPEKLHTDFLIPMDARYAILETFKDGASGHVCNATEGFTTTIPLMDPYYIPIERELASSEKELHELSQVRTLAYMTQSLCLQYNAQKKRAKQRMMSSIPTLVLAGVFLPTYPFQSLSPEGFSSVGVVDRLLTTRIPLPGHTQPIDIIDWTVGLLMSKHRGSLQFSLHIWTFQEQLNLSVVHTPHITKERTALFLDTMRSTLKLFLMAYEQHGKPIDIPTAPPTPFKEPTLFQYVGRWLQSLLSH